MSSLLLAAVCALMLAAGCASRSSPALAQVNDSPLPGTIGVVVQAAPAGVRVTALGEGSPAAVAGVRMGDIVLRFNGTAVADGRQFYRLVTGSRPGSVAQVEVLRDGVVHRLEVPVQQIDTTPRA